METVSNQNRFRTRAPTGQYGMHLRQFGHVEPLTTGVPAAIRLSVMDTRVTSRYGQASMHLSHRMHTARNSSSGRAPGGRSKRLFGRSRLMNPPKVTTSAPCPNHPRNPRRVTSEPSLSRLLMPLIFLVYRVVGFLSPRGARGERTHCHLDPSLLTPPSGPTTPRRRDGRRWQSNPRGRRKARPTPRPRR
jgi:hypothetical protein